MQFTIKEIERQVRIKTLDTDADAYRYAPIEVYQAIRDGVRLIWHKKPESRYVDGLMVSKGLLIGGAQADFVVPETFPVTIGSTSYDNAAYVALTINMEERYMEPLVYYVIHQMYLKDDTDTANSGLAKTYYEKFMEALS